MLKKFVWTLLALALLVPATASAQSSQCDVVAPTSGTVTAGQPMTVSACWNEKDANGNPAVATSWALYDVVGTNPPVRMTPTFTRDATVSVSGEHAYSSTFTAPSTASVHTYTIAVVTAVAESAKSTPFVLTVSLAAAAPTVPTHLQAR